MTIKIDDPQIEAIFINEFKSDIKAFTKFIKESLKKNKEKQNFFNNEDKNSEISFSKYKINSFKNITDSVKWQQEMRNEWDR